jgi:hypothetical protein
MTADRNGKLRGEVATGAKSQVKEVGRALGLNTMTPTVTQVFRRLHDEMTRKGLDQFSVSDIVIEVPVPIHNGGRKRARAAQGSTQASTQAKGEA